MINELADDYSEYLRVDLAKELFEVFNIHFILTSSVDLSKALLSQQIGLPMTAKSGFESRSGVPRILAPAEETIEDILTRLEEFESLVDMVKNDPSYDLSQPVIDIAACKEELNALCERIDSLETFVGKVSRDMDVVESHLDAAKAEIGGSDETFKNMLKPLFFRTLDSAITRASPRYQEGYGVEPPLLYSSSSSFVLTKLSLVLFQNHCFVDKVQKRRGLDPRSLDL
ncbi:unnamed protein product [Timema podura]|uniref:Uncharacterized protein n=1 Tax=Timema podura TaxID=61482 RepID=A0ABN7NN31_TIMPD|nr:unnamed protein product [Timema podura]